MIYDRFQQYRKKIFTLAAIGWLLFSVNLLYNAVPDELYVVEGSEENIELELPVTLERKTKSVAVFQSTNEKKEYILSCKFLNLIPIKDVSVHVVNKTYIMPSGMPIGIYTRTNGILVIGTGKVTCRDGLNYEPAASLVKSGDYIMSVNDIPIAKKKELIRFVNESMGKPVILGIMRENKFIKLKLEPVILEDGSYKLGIWVRDDVAGVGTLTYVKKDLEYGALGHPISDADTGVTISLSEGKIYNTDIVGIVKGEDGSPGELTGVINYNKEYCLGSIFENTGTGIYGNLDGIPQNMKQVYLEVGMKQDIKKEKAYILSSFDGTLREYTIEIDDVDFSSKEKNKGILFHVTDKTLLDETGGIVQGMSGSPILQDGKIIGAVTHVFISDASKGYGIFIENMLENN